MREFLSFEVGSKVILNHIIEAWATDQVYISVCFLKYFLRK